MHPTVQLITAWCSFQEQHPGKTIVDFCTDYLSREQERNSSIKFGRSASPPGPASELSKMLGRIGRLLNNYSSVALRECGVAGFEDFFYLSDISTDNGIKKTGLIYANFHELSSGLLIISRLKKRSLITEKNDSDDKRIVRLYITAKGENVLKKCYAKLDRINELFFADMSRRDMKWCSQLLSPTESKFSLRWLQDRRKSLSELIN